MADGRHAGGSEEEVQLGERQRVRLRTGRISDATLLCGVRQHEDAVGRRWCLGEGREDTGSEVSSSPLARTSNVSAPGRPIRARSHCRSVLPRIHFIPGSLIYSVPLFLKRQCDWTLCPMQERRAAGVPHGGGGGGRAGETGVDGDVGHDVVVDHVGLADIARVFDALDHLLQPVPAPRARVHTKLICAATLWFHPLAAHRPHLVCARKLAQNTLTMCLELSVPLLESLTGKC